MSTSDPTKGMENTTQLLAVAGETIADIWPRRLPGEEILAEETAKTNPTFSLEEVIQWSSADSTERNRMYNARSTLETSSIRPTREMSAEGTYKQEYGYVLLEPTKSAECAVVDKSDSGTTASDPLSTLEEQRALLKKKLKSQRERRFKK